MDREIKIKDGIDLINKFNNSVEIICLVTRILPDLIVSYNKEVYKGKMTLQADFSRKVKFVSHTTVGTIVAKNHNDYPRYIVKTDSRYIFDEVFVLGLLLQNASNSLLNRFNLYLNELPELREMFEKLKQWYPGEYERYERES